MDNDLNSLVEAAKKIGHQYKDINILRHALTHRSYANEHRVKDNERLEFLGDSVLSVIISDYMFRKLENRTEGDLSKFRASIVCEQSLAEAAEKFGLNRYIFLGKGEERMGGRKRPSIVSDAFEAVIASIYLDAGMEVARSWVLKHLGFKVDEIISGNGSRDYKTHLQETVQKGHTGRVTYQTIAEGDEESDDRFSVIVMIDGVKKAEGKGRSKKDAEQDAAKHVLEKMI